MEDIKTLKGGCHPFAVCLVTLSVQGKHWNLITTGWVQMYYFCNNVILKQYFLSKRRLSGSFFLIYFKESSLLHCLIFYFSWANLRMWSWVAITFMTTNSETWTTMRQPEKRAVHFPQWRKGPPEALQNYPTLEQRRITLKLTPCSYLHHNVISKESESADVIRMCRSQTNSKLPQSPPGSALYNHRNNLFLLMKPLHLQRILLG